MGLLESDDEWENALAEAEVFQMPVQLRGLFATILLLGNPTDPVALWQDHAQSFAEDFRLNNSEENAHYLAWKAIDNTLFQQGRSILDFGIPEPNHDDHASTVSTEFDREEEAQIAERNRGILNGEQTLIFDEIASRIDHNQMHQPRQSAAFFIDGPGGSGKTLLYNTIIAFCRGKGINIAAAAWTGIAATLLQGGQTMHSLFKLPVPILDTSVCIISPTSTYAQRLRETDVFVLDEASMIPTHALHAIDRSLQDISGNALLFGGKVFVLGGDFRQVLPVVPRGSRAAIIDQCLKRSKLWSQIREVSTDRKYESRRRRRRVCGMVASTWQRSITFSRQKHKRAPDQCPQ